MKKEDFNNSMNPEALHNRAREASIELRKLIITLSTGILGFSFLIITADKSKISNMFQYFLFFSIVTMALTIVLGLLHIHADGKRNYYRAKWLQVKDNLLVKEKIYTDYNKWKFFFKIYKGSSRITFGLGLLSLVIALYDRII